MNKRITRSSDDRFLAGVCGGLGEYFGIDSTWIRLGFIFMTPFSYFLTILVYIVCVFLMPEKRNIQETSYHARLRHLRKDSTKELNKNKK
ncbi:PspC domain-containing protein [Companilactobacillus baiquanensis]|uniref:PspC domain-containing protein n=1 Tax=Companilactobacillus baiquanensis TaxID=2486005 RepID=A0ABW1V125_9LACO|nr:PspC domain-containing protein [Companilactobacillus baiquanensis]